MKRDDDHVTLGEARAKLRDEAMSGGGVCPCCQRHTQIYRRTINKGQAESLIKMYKIAGKDWVHLPTQIPAKSREEAKLRYWGLVEEANEERPDGGRAGWWRITDLGEQFIRGEVQVPTHVLVYNHKFLGYDSDEGMWISDALGHLFDLSELLNDIPKHNTK